MHLCTQSRRTILLLAVVAAVLSATACASPVREAAPSAEPRSAEGTSAPRVFSAEAWRSDPDGRSLAAAREVVEQDLLRGMSVQEVRELLGQENRADMSADYRTGAYYLGYELNEGPTLEIHFEDGLVERVGLHEPAGDPEEVLTLVGKWALDDPRSREFDLRNDGKLICTFVTNGKSARYLYRWKVVSPGVIVLRDVGTPSDRAALYRYRLDADNLQLTYLDSTTRLDQPERPVAWSPWLTGGSPESLELRRL